MLAEDESTQDVRTIFVGGLSEKSTDSLLYELFFQAGSKFFLFICLQNLNFIFLLFQDLLNAFRSPKTRILEEINHSVLSLTSIYLR